MAGDGFTYSGSSVLKNKENITDDVAFENWLSERTQARFLQLRRRGCSRLGFRYCTIYAEF